MLFFYIGLAFVMYTATLGIFEMSILISNQRFMNKTKFVNSQDIILQKNNDKVFLDLLNEIDEFNTSSNFYDLGLIEKENICLDISYSLTNNDGKYYSILTGPNYNILNSYNPGIKSFTPHPRFANSCSLVNDSHRVIINNNESNYDEYSYYSCIIDIDPICRFELVD